MFFGHLIKHNIKMDNKLKNINYLINFIIYFSFFLILWIQVSSVTDITTKITKYYVFKCDFAKKYKILEKIFCGVISDVILQLSPRYSFYSSKIDLP